MSTEKREIRQPVIVKYATAYRNGVQATQLSRAGIGYVAHGRKHIYYGDVCHEISRGDVFFLSAGMHYMEDIPESDKPFEQFMFYYTPETMNDIRSILSMDFGMAITNDHVCPECADTNHASERAWGAVRNFFASVAGYVREGCFADNPSLEKMKMAELVCLILARPDCCVKSKILRSIDTETESFERLVQMHIFDDITIDELAARCGRSLTSFKKDFRRHFHESPHKWIIRRRLTHARMLLITTTRTIADIGVECGFSNTSHFIKLFRSEYGHTPAAYRNKSLREEESKLKKAREKAPQQV